jgi:uncharacterized membrane protein
VAGAHGAHGEGGMPASPRVRQILTWVMVPLALLTVVGLALLWPEPPERLDNDRGSLYDATVVAVEEVACTEPERTTGLRRCGEVTLRLDTGPDEGGEVIAPVPGGPGAPRVSVGDEVVVHAGTDPADPSAVRYGIADHQRGMPLVWLVVLFAVAIIAFGRWRGVASLAGLGACFALLLTFVVPGILGGRPPLLVSVVGAATVLFVIMYLVHGVSVRTSVAVLGTLAAVVLTGVLGFLGTSVTHLTGFLGGSEELTLLNLYPDLDLRHILLAGIIFGSLGVLDDVTVTQAATVGELARADPRLSRTQLYRAGERVGRAHVASVVNTLVLAYAGASLPLLLLVATSGMSAGDALTAETLAQEIVRSVVATVGLVAAVPITTALAALVSATGRRDAGAAGGGPRHDPARREAPPPRPRAAARPEAPVDPGEALAPHHQEW